MTVCPRLPGLLPALASMLFLSACGGSGDVPPPDAGATETLREPQVLRSSGGQLQVALNVAQSTVQVDGLSVSTTVYNGLYVPPVLSLKPGDTLRLKLNNASQQATNEHYHGLDVSPRADLTDGTMSDNVFVHTEPGQSTDYKVLIPADHHAGLYWYHSHMHGNSEAQVMGGLSGGLVIEGLLDPVPQLSGIRERLLMLKDIQIGPDGKVPDDIDPSAPTHRTVNGQTNPTMVIAPGETQLLRIANISANMYYNLSLQGHKLVEIARDGIRHNQPIAFDQLLLPPSARTEVLIQGAAAGSYALTTGDINTGPQGDQVPGTTLMTVVSQGVPRVPLAIPGVMPGPPDLRTLPVARKRTIVFDESADGNTFYIDSGSGPVQFDPNRVDSTIQSGTIEEWTILNPTGEWHVFHIHQTNFQITEKNGVPQPFIGHQDTVNVDYQADTSSPPGQVKMLMDFRDPNIIGRFVYHCHILEHEDGGMMAVAEVVPPGGLVGTAPRNQTWLAKAGGAIRDTVGQAVARITGADRQMARIRREAQFAAAQAASMCLSPDSEKKKRPPLLVEAPASEWVADRIALAGERSAR